MSRGTKAGFAQSEPGPFGQATAGLRPGQEFDQLAVATGRMHVQDCGTCEAVVYPPRVLCPRCGATSLRWQPVRGTGVVYSVTEVSSRRGDAHAVALIDLDEGFRMMATVPVGTAIGTAVKIIGLGTSDDVVVSFGPINESESA